MRAIRHILGGKIYVSERISAYILEVFSGGQAAPERSSIKQLSDREFEVFELIDEGLSAREIARRLHLSPKTVDAHRANIKKKLNIKSKRVPSSFLMPPAGQRIAQAGSKPASATNRSSCATCKGKSVPIVVTSDTNDHRRRDRAKQVDYWGRRVCLQAQSRRFYSARNARCAQPLRRHAELPFNEIHGSSADVS
jgi:DNA-binding CsgD family transcriptional regulator